MTSKLGNTLVQRFGSSDVGETLWAGSQRGDRVSDLGLEQATGHLPDEGAEVGGHYRLVRLLGEGMFGRVFEAERTDVPEHKVALKLIARVVYADRDVERELEMLASSSHPHIVQLKDHGVTEDYIWLTMPFYEGETLAERLERSPLSLREAYDLFVPIARGLQALHDKGLRHQDIKPENIYLARFGDLVHPVILDLGVAVERTADFVAGTVLYGAPEQVTALGGVPHELDEKIDCYALGCTLLRALVGEDFFPGENASTPFDIAEAFGERETEPLRREALHDLTGPPRDALRHALQRWLAQEPADRPSAHAMAAEMDVLLEQERAAAKAIETAIDRQKSSLRRVRMAAGAMLLVGLGAVAYTYAHRATLRLASELETARAAGRASFDKLDTCVAAHDLEERKVRSCELQRRDEQKHYDTALDDLSKAGSQAQRVLAKKLHTTSVRLRGCRDEARDARQDLASANQSLDEQKAAMAARQDAHASVLQSWEDRAKGWTAERAAFDKKEHAWHQERAGWDDARRKLEAKAKASQAALDKRASAHGECRQDLAACIEDRDTCMAPRAARPAAPAPHGKAKTAPPSAKPPPPAPSKPAAPKPPAPPKAPAAPGAK